jgi:glycine betaine catabolism B
MTLRASLAMSPGTKPFNFSRSDWPFRMSNYNTHARIGAYLWDALPAKWTAERDERLICCGVRNETHDVKSFLFRTSKPALFRFKPGQFLTLELNINGETINRCYTISSPPTRPDTVSITVKRHPGGIVSNWLHDNLKPGSNVNVLAPAGDFSAALSPAEKYLFLSGGSGITPLMSMARTFHDLGDDRDIVFVHSARSPRDIIFRPELASIEAGAKHFKTMFVCETVPDGEAWSGARGYLNLATLRDAARDYQHREIFCCGPAPYMAAVREILTSHNFDLTRYHEESFTFGVSEVPSAASDIAKKTVAGATFKIEFTKSGRTIECGPDQFILEAAKAAGMRLPFSCTKGLCGTCKSKKLSGEVIMTHQGGIRQREIDQGMILPCCSKPLSDVVLEK